VEEKTQREGVAEEVRAKDENMTGKKKKK